MAGRSNRRQKAHQNQRPDRQFHSGKHLTNCVIEWQTRKWVTNQPCRNAANWHWH